MDELEALQSLGLTLPSPVYIGGMIVFSLVGMVAWWRGRKKGGAARSFWIGLALMLYPYVVWDTLWLYIVGVLLCVGLVYPRPRG